MFEAVKKQSLSEEVFEQLRARIVSHKLKPGDELPSERVLCELLNVNRGAVREGIKRLQQAGLVQVRHGGATTVLDFQAEAGLELLASLLVNESGQVQSQVARSIVRMRQALSPEIAADAASNRSDEQAAKLDALLKQMRASSETLQRQYLAFEFWECLVECSNNIAYRLAMNSMRRAYQPILQLMTGLLEKSVQDVGSFEAITEAVHAGDSITARQCAKGYIDASSEAIFQFLDAYEQHNAAND
jgi:GntR family transcriptional regulator, transcriptional repressor for pyruvate dehydrogenase complex